MNFIFVVSVTNSFCQQNAQQTVKVKFVIKTLEHALFAKMAITIHNVTKVSKCVDNIKFLSCRISI